MIGVKDPASLPDSTCSLAVDTAFTSLGAGTSASFYTIRNMVNGKSVTVTNTVKECMMDKKFVLSCEPSTPMIKYDPVTGKAVATIPKFYHKDGKQVIVNFKCALAQE